MCVCVCVCVCVNTYLYIHLRSIYKVCRDPVVDCLSVCVFDL